MAAERLLALVEAEDRLEARPLRPPRGAAGVQGDGVEGLVQEAALVGQVEDAAAFHGGKRLNLRHQGGPLGLTQPVQ